MGETAKRLYNGCLVQESKENESEWALPLPASLPVPLPYLCICLYLRICLCWASVTRQQQYLRLLLASASSSAPASVRQQQQSIFDEFALLPNCATPTLRCALFFTLFSLFPLFLSLSLPLLFPRCSCRSMLSSSVSNN